MFASLRKRVSSKCLLVVYSGICVIIYFISWSKLRSIPTDSILLGKEDPEEQRTNDAKRTLEPSYYLRLGQDEEGSQAVYNDSLDLSETSVLSTQVTGNMNNLPSAVPILPAPVSFKEGIHSVFDLKSSVDSTLTTSESSPIKEDITDGFEEYEDFHSIPSDFLNTKASISTSFSIVPTPTANQSVEISPDILLKPANGNETEMEVAEYLDYYRNVDADNIINEGDTKTILLWDSFQEDPMDLGSGTDVFRNCPVTSCFITENRQYMPEDKYDAIVFHRTRKNKENGWPKKRDYKQKYIFFSWQTPFDTYFDDRFYDSHKHFYNWTLSYRRDSDIHYPYAVVFQESTEYKMPKPKDLKLRRGIVAWYLNKCNTPHAIRLLNYVKRLQKFIPVDIYGKCGNRKCRNCFELIEKRYFFSISFEDIACQDYVSGKLFNNLDINVIPIIEGKSDYQSIVPPHSVIDIKDFESPKLLADYLKKLTRKLSLYLEYFAWKKDFYISNAREYALCQLCKKLHEPVKFSSYEDIKKWYFGVKCFK